MRVLAYWFVVFFALVFGTTVTRIPATAIYSPSALILVFLPLPFFLYCRLGGRGMLELARRMMRLELSESDHRTIDQLNAAAFLFSGIGIVVGMIRVLRNLSNLDQIGPGVAFAFLCLMYGALVPILLLPFLDASGAKRLARQAAVYAFVVVPAIMGAMMFTLNVTKVI